jgi:LytS/YehU family sensor histidine kinase
MIKAMIDFSAYLRRNMESLSYKGLINVEQELNHVKGYLDLEEMIYDDLLSVVYNVEAAGFMLPSLTIQPIVENAVKHGIGKKEDGGTITLTARETDDDYLVIVSDDGAGFDINNPRQEDREHIGIDNVRRRLKEQCNGTLEIVSEPGKGTTATIRIPRY